MRTKTLAFPKYVVLTALTLTTNAHAAPQGWYLGLKGGYTKNDHSCESTALECDRSGSGYGIFGGYDFNRRLGLEFGYTDLGDSSAVYPEISLDGEISAFDISAKYTRQLFGESQLFAKLGATYWQAEVNGWEVKVDGSGFSPNFGLGVSMPFTDRFSARLEYQYFGKVGDSELGHTQPNFLSLGLTWHFPPRVVPVPYPHSFLPEESPAEPEVAQSDTDTDENSLAKANAVATTESPSQPEPATEAVADNPPPEMASEQDPVVAPATPEPVVELQQQEQLEQRQLAQTPAEGPIIIDDRNHSPLFARGSTVLKINYALEKIAVDLLRSPNLFVHIVVHTDDEGGSAQNQQLAKARGDKLADYLIWQGVNPDHITVEGKGEADPVVKKNTDAARARNRRAEFFISETRPRR